MFRKHQKTADDELAEIEAQLLKLQGMLDLAQQELAGAMGVRRSLLINDARPEPDKLAAAESTCRAVQDRVDAVGDALAVLGEQYESKKQAAAESRDQEHRGSVAAEIERRAQQIDNAATRLTAALATGAKEYHGLLEAIGGAGLAKGVSGFDFSAEIFAASIFHTGVQFLVPGLPTMINEVGIVSNEDAAAATRRLQSDRLRAIATEIRSGRTAASLPATPAEIASPKLPTIATTSVVLKEPIAYRDISGVIVRCVAGGVELPEPVAQRAVEMDVGCWPDTTEAKKVLANFRTGTAISYGFKGRWRDLGIDLSATAEQTWAAS